MPQPVNLPGSYLCPDFALKKKFPHGDCLAMRVRGFAVEVIWCVISVFNSKCDYKIGIYVNSSRECHLLFGSAPRISVEHLQCTDQCIALLTSLGSPPFTLHVIVSPHSKEKKVRADVQLDSCCSFIM